MREVMPGHPPTPPGSIDQAGEEHRCDMVSDPNHERIVTGRATMGRWTCPSCRQLWEWRRVPNRHRIPHHQWTRIGYPPPSVIDQEPFAPAYGFLAGLDNVLLPGMTRSAAPPECPGVALGVCLCQPDAPFNVVDQPPVNATAFVWPPCGVCGAPAGGTHHPDCKFAGTGR